MPLQHRQGSVFDAPEGTCIVHACNAQGHWGAGVALAMRVAFPDAFDDFWERKRECGQAVVYHREQRPKFTIASLVTSEHYGRRRDPPPVIIANTRKALHQLFLGGNTLWTTNTTFHSPKINGGLFGVPWSSTEAALLDLISAAETVLHKRISWTVWTP